MATPTFDCKITTPMALNETNSAKSTMRWFVHKTEYDPRWAEVRFLVNGQRAFGSIYQDMLNAKHSIDIICWGFQPSMYFVRDGGKSMRIGELLAHKGEKDNVKVRLLCWHDPLYVAEAGENNMPGFDRKVTTLKHLPDSWINKVPLASPDYQTWSEAEFDMYWYERANLNNVTDTVHKNAPDKILDEMSKFTPGALRDDVARLLGNRIAGFKNIELATRSFDVSERTEIIARVKAHGKAAGWSDQLISGMCQGMGGEPTHHQKTVLIDYEYPDIAVGYVMGHNMLDQYWDTDEHSYKPKSPKLGRSGPTPWQDISSRVTGPILQDINANFCQAWDQATGQKLTEARKKYAGKHALCLAGSTQERGVMAQVLRTQSQHGKTDISKLYLQALNNATQYVFVQNQYFRWDEFADTIKQVATKQHTAGRDGGTHGPIYLFVITNSSDAAVSTGTFTTYEMLDSLGYSDRMPGVKYAEADDALLAKKVSLESELAKAQQEEQRMRTQSYDWSQMAGAANYIGELRGQEGVLSGEIGDVEKQLAQLKQELGASVKIDPGAQIVSPDGNPILKVLICTLVAPDSPANAWVPVYVHAKLGIIDDAFTTLGSANINFRSMNVDSEINIALENGQIATELRQQLWGLHTRTSGSGDSAHEEPSQATDSVSATGQNGPTEAFKAWTNIIVRNNRHRDANQAPISSIVEFFRVSKQRSYKD
ncbi:phospholipase D-like domain-containing protein [Trinickia soli]|uniref:Phospholipase n=1 Tax=Trinickia soli TaxID=380675 RepID=A0A2N7VW79_9BURK|nr:phospholipase D-like domain-containing protein [Trinickia soli]PMS21393.1 phospholipase [Trinickia soli]CAB3699743.1 Cardiolipin synthase [Trinickia soli]